MNKSESEKRFTEEMDRRLMEEGEDSTHYGEFIASFDHWLTFEEQRKRAQELEKL